MHPIVSYVFRNFSSLVGWCTHIIITHIQPKLERFSAMQIFLAVTWVWAVIGMQISKAFYMLFYGLLRMPDKWFVNTVAPTEPVQILFARTEKEIITGKLRLFIKWFMERNNNSCCALQLTRLFNSRLMYICYITKDDAVNPLIVFDEVKYYLINFDKMNIVTEKNEIQKILFNQIVFE